MSYTEHDLVPQGPARKPAGPLTAQRTPVGTDSPVLDLQRLAGNSAVSRAIRTGVFDGLPIQRLDTDEEEGLEVEAGAEGGEVEAGAEGGEVEAGAEGGEVEAGAEEQQAEDQEEEAEVEIEQEEDEEEEMAG